MVWVIEDAPELPANLVGTLMGYANHADRDGRNSYPSHRKVALYARKSTRQVIRDTKDLVGRGLLVPGDQSVVAHLPGDSRPVVYDLPIGIVCPKRREALGRKDRASSERGMTPMSPRDGNGVTSKVERGDTGDSGGVTPTSPKPSFEPSVEPSSLSLPAKALADIGVPAKEREIMIREIPKLPGLDIRSPGWWITAASNGTLAAHVATVRTNLAEQADRKQARRAPPPKTDPDSCVHGRAGVCTQCRYEKVASLYHESQAKGTRPVMLTSWQREIWDQIQAAEMADRMADKSERIAP